MKLDKFDSGAVRNNIDGTGRFDLISPFALKRLAQTYEEGAITYADRNWEKGYAYSKFINHALIHINDYMEGKRDEDHLAHAAWNIFAVMHMEATKPQYNDMPHYRKNNTKFLRRKPTHQMTATELIQAQEK